MKNPYQGIKDIQFWRKSISNIESFKVDPVSHVKFKISPFEKVATAGSCFAQHISKRLAGIGFNYFVAENNDALSLEERASRNYGTFSARFGNLYTARQLLQLFEEAFEGRARSQTCWQMKNGRFVDPFRPNIEPNGLESVEEVLSDRIEHLDCVRQMFLNADVFVFTLGLTECWREKSSGEVYPLAPGVVAGNFDESVYEFVNFSANEVEADLTSFLLKLKAINPKVKVLLTVSPVPLIATFEDRHVLVSTTYSKSALRVSAEEAIKKFTWVDYFPSYEIITGNFNLGKYYEEDLREVNSVGVDHAMRCFLRNYTEADDSSNATEFSSFQGYSSPSEKTDNTGGNGIICDEELIARINI